MPIRPRTLVLAALVLLALSTAGAMAKPLYCDFACYPPYNGGPDDVCTCPEGTENFGLITTCGSYFGGVCDGAAFAAMVPSADGDALPAAETELPAEEPARETASAIAPRS